MPSSFHRPTRPGSKSWTRPISGDLHPFPLPAQPAWLSLLEIRRDGLWERQLQHQRGPPVLIRPRPPEKISNNLAGDEGILVEGINRAEAVVAVRDQDLPVLGVPHQQQGGEGLAFLDLFPVLIHVGIADP